jgi:hypothetical protein
VTVIVPVSPSSSVIVPLPVAESVSDSAVIAPVPTKLAAALLGAVTLPNPIAL